MKKKWETQKEVHKAMKEEAALKEILAVQKKKEKIVIRNDQLIVENNEEVKEKGPVREKYGFLRKLLMGPIGVLAWSALFAAAGFFVYKEVFLMAVSKPAKEE